MSSSLILTIIYTIGHFFIAIACVTFITGASLELATADALIEPGINAIWFYVLHRTYEHYFSSSDTVKTN